MGKREREGNIGQGLFSPGTAPSHAYLRDSKRRVGRYAYACDTNMRHTHTHTRMTYTSAPRVSSVPTSSRRARFQCMYTRACVKERVYVCRRSRRCASSRSEPERVKAYAYCLRTHTDGGRSTTITTTTTTAAPSRV